MLYIYQIFIISNLIFVLNIILVVFGEFYKLSFIIVIIKFIIGTYNIIYIIKFNFSLEFLSRIHLKCICCFTRENNYFQLN